MKELSTEQKAQAYDKAIEIINDYYQKIKYSSLSNASTDREVLEKAFPQLKESEDERIRNFISNELACLRAADEKGTIRYNELTEAIAWLERQGEQKSINDLTPQKAMDIAVAKCFDEQKPYGQREECVDCQFNYAGECKGYCAMKRGEQNLVNFEEAEKEKSDFVSGKFIQCRKSFNEFKEDNSYWLEYIGDDTYIGRSDNILNQKFHITPRQLYRLFSQEHCI